MFLCTVPPAAAAAAAAPDAPVHKNNASLRGREELANMRTTVAFSTPPNSESMTSFKDTRPLPVGETDDVCRRRLIYQSRYRGMVEMDIIFGSFAQAKLDKLGGPVLREYDTLLRQYDNDLFNWLVSGQAPPSEISSLEAWKELKGFVERNRDELLGHRL